MMTQTAAGPDATPAPVPPQDDLGIDRAFLMQMARIPFIAIAWVLASFAATFIWNQVASPPNYAPLIVICFGMVLAAVCRAAKPPRRPQKVTLPAPCHRREELPKFRRPSVRNRRGLVLASRHLCCRYGCHRRKDKQAALKSSHGVLRIGILPVELS